MPGCLLAWRPAARFLFSVVVLLFSFHTLVCSAGRVDVKSLSEFRALELFSLFPTLSASYERLERVAQLKATLCPTSQGNWSCEETAGLLYSRLFLRQPQYAIYTPPSVRKGDPYVALLLTGQVRCFLAPLVQYFWKQLVSQIRSLGYQVRIFAAIELVSSTFAGHVFSESDPRQKHGWISRHNETAES